MANSLNVVDDPDDAEGADYVVCAPATVRTSFSDNVFDFCCRCGVKVQHRPHAPVSPKRICMACAMPGIEAEASKGELEILVTSQSAAEVATLLLKRGDA